MVGSRPRLSFFFCGNRYPTTLNFFHFYSKTCQCPSTGSPFQWNLLFSVAILMPPPSPMATALVTLISLPGLKMFPRTLVLFRLRHFAIF